MKLFECDHANELKRMVDVYERLNNDHTALLKRISALEVSETVFRDKVLRKIQTRKDLGGEEESKDLYNGMLIKEA